MATPWMAACYSFYGKPQTFKKAVFFKCLQAIITTGGCIAAPVA